MRRALGRVPTFVLFIVTFVLVAAIVVLVQIKMIKPAQEQLESLKGQLDQEEAVAARAATADAEKAQVTDEWLQAQARLQELQDTRSFPISSYQPLGAMIALMYEYRHDLPRVTQEWLDGTDITLNTAMTFPQAAADPPQIPPNGFIEVGSTFNLSVSGSLQQIEDFYSSLSQYKRIATIGGLDLSGDGDMLTATVPLRIYLLAETEPAPAAAPAGGGMEPGAPGGMSGPGGMPGGEPEMPGGGPPPPGGGGGGEAPGPAPGGGGADAGGGMDE